MNMSVFLILYVPFFCDQMMVLLRMPKAQTLQKHAITFLAALDRTRVELAFNLFHIHGITVIMLRKIQGISSSSSGLH